MILHTQDDFVDRLSRIYSAGALFVFAILAVFSQNNSDNFVCWAPAQFTDSHRQYAYATCWASEMYYEVLSSPAESFENEFQKNATLHSYHLWIPTILFLMSFAYLLPWLLGKLLNGRSDINILAIKQSISNSQRASTAESANLHMANAVQLLQYYCLGQFGKGIQLTSVRHQVLHPVCILFTGRFIQSFRCFSMLLTKVLNVVNVIAQLVLVENMLGIKHILIFNDYSQHWFPRTVLCDFEIRHQARLHNYVMQCSLPINVYYEKLFSYIGIWLILLTCASIYSLFSWLLRCFYWPQQYYFIERQLQAMVQFTPHNLNDINKFARSYLGQEGLFVLRRIANEAGDVIAAQMVVNLWIKVKATELKPLEINETEAK